MNDVTEQTASESTIGLEDAGDNFSVRHRRNRLKTTSFQEQRPTMKRFCDRDNIFHQSNGTFNIVRKNRRMRMYLTDWFHTLLDKRTEYILLGATGIYIFVILIFAIGYFYSSEICNMEIYRTLDAIYFSLETLMTIGFSANDPFFNGCAPAVILITSQSILSIIMDAICFGLLYSRLSRANTRASTIIFSNKAIIRKIGGHFYFMFQVLIFYLLMELQAYKNTMTRD